MVRRFLESGGGGKGRNYESKSIEDDLWKMYTISNLLTTRQSTHVPHRHKIVTC